MVQFSNNHFIKLCTLGGTLHLVQLLVHFSKRMCKLLDIIIPLVVRNDSPATYLKEAIVCSKTTVRCSCRLWLSLLNLSSSLRIEFSIVSNRPGAFSSKSLIRTGLYRGVLFSSWWWYSASWKSAKFVKGIFCYLINIK